MKFNPYISQIHETAKEKGWWSQPRSIENLCMLVISEIAEATEQARKDNPPIWFIDPVLGKPHPFDIKEWNGKDAIQKPEGEAVELADAVIRTLDMAGHFKVDIDERILRSEITQLITSDWFAKMDPLEAHFDLLAHIGCNSSDAVGRMDFNTNIADFCHGVDLYFQYKGWDLEKTMQLKMSYNKTRERRHGGKLY